MEGHCRLDLKKNGYHQLSMTDYIPVVCEKALLLPIDFFCKHPWHLREQGSLDKLTATLREMRSTANSLNIKTTGNIKGSMHRMVS